ncbi:ATP-binding cassette domain-containing protein [Micromonospora sp. NPDC093277]|uniref:ATP-binding cassette domain-containing protein n=1 Tax=Micromonospora sp. NPDC093277 TaxID=3364291 RepID=UPI00381E6C23
MNTAAATADPGSAWLARSWRCTPPPRSPRTLRLFGGLHGLRGPLLRGRIEKAVAALDLADLLTRRVGTLSGGQQRRVRTAAALLHEPAVLLLDEPTVRPGNHLRADEDSSENRLSLPSAFA